jgi:murein DD-endopeptidase MepM/ murein hydrolase activator NlpD
LDKKVKVIIILFVLLAVFLASLAFVSKEPALAINPPITAIGTSTPVKIHVVAPHGVRRIVATIEQNGATYPMLDKRYPTHRVVFREHKDIIDVLFAAGKNKAPALKDGKARITIAAESNDFLGRTARTSADIDVITTPPRVSVDGFQHYINQGGCELVTFTASGYWSEGGVRVGKYTFRSFPMPGAQSPNARFAIFAYPWDLPPGIEPQVYVRNPAGTEAHGHFWFKLFPKKFRAEDFNLTDQVMNRLVDQIDPSSTGDLLQRFLRINGPMRRANNQTLADLRLKSEERVLWHGPFVQLGNSKVEAHFADVRTYIYQGKKVDEQVHLGFDLAVTQHTPVVAANDGKVLWASDLGIYGNCIVIDHGYGLQSIYGHLADFEVKVGDTVKRGQEIGKSDSTGLALGDHLHFSMQVDGVQVNPVEWWDQHWIHDRILSKLPESQ